MHFFLHIFRSGKKCQSYFCYEFFSELLINRNSGTGRRRSASFLLMPFSITHCWREFDNRQINVLPTLGLLIFEGTNFREFR